MNRWNGFANFFFSKISDRNVQKLRVKVINNTCLRSRWIRGHTFFANIFVNTKKFAKPFGLFIWADQVESFKPKKWLKILWHCPFRVLVIQSKLYSVTGLLEQFNHRCPACTVFKITSQMKFIKKCYIEKKFQPNLLLRRDCLNLVTLSLRKYQVTG